MGISTELAYLEHITHAPTMAKDIPAGNGKEEMPLAIKGTPLPKC